MERCLAPRERNAGRSRTFLTSPTSLAIAKSNTRSLVPFCGTSLPYSRDRDKCSSHQLCHHRYRLHSRMRYYCAFLRNINYVHKSSNGDLPAQGGGGRESHRPYVFDNVPRPFYNSPTFQIIMLQLFARLRQAEDSERNAFLVLSSMTTACAVLVFEMTDAASSKFDLSRYANRIENREILFSTHAT